MDPSYLLITLWGHKPQEELRWREHQHYAAAMAARKEARQAPQRRILPRWAAASRGLIARLRKLRLSANHSAAAAAEPEGR